MINEVSIKDLFGSKDAFSLEKILSNFDKKDKSEVINLLDKMVRNGDLYYSNKKKKYMLLDAVSLMKVKVCYKNGNYYAMDKDDNKIVIPSMNLNGADYNDEVIISLNDDGLGCVVRVVNKVRCEAVGEVVERFGTKFINDKVFGLIDIISSNDNNLVSGHMVRYIRDGRNAKVLSVIGHKDDPLVDVISIMAENNFYVGFSDDVYDELKDIPNSLSDEDIELAIKNGRVDFRDKEIFTIDGVDTKDIDDAISIIKNDDGTYELGVHIADVSHYVKSGSLLDKEAYERGTSVYLVDRVLPMLPHRLSNGICSLNPGVDRLAMSCIMKIKDNGKVVSSKITPSVIRSRIQMTYNKVNDILDKGIVADGYEEFVDKLKLMRELSDKLRKKMVGRGYIEFSSREAKILVDENCHPYEIKLREEGTGEHIIENFMIAANETVATHVYFMELPFLYRVHGEPNEEKINNFFE